MLEPYRSEFNARFTPQKYDTLLRLLAQRLRGPVPYRVCETPAFFSRELMERMVQAGVELTTQLLGNRSYVQASRDAIPAEFCVPGQGLHPHFMTVDFGLVRSVDGGYEPKLVEMQAFPSVFGFQPILAQAYAEAYSLPDLGPPLTTFLSGLDEAAYWSILRETILGEHAPENVILTDVEPTMQKTLPDFHCHEDQLGIRTVDISQLVKEGNKLFYRGDRGQLVPVKRIYNRAIVDEIVRKNIQLPFDYRDELDVEWAGHPNWYFQISKFSIPHLDHPTVPTAVFLDEFFEGDGRDRLPADRNHWVFKPLYSFAGKGVSFAPTDAELGAIPPAERRNYLLQERVAFEPAIVTPEGPTQAEIRILYAWPDGKAMIPMISLVRMGRGLMMGVDQNRDKTWVGASASFCPL